MEWSRKGPWWSQGWEEPRGSRQVDDSLAQTRMVVAGPEASHHSKSFPGKMKSCKHPEAAGVVEHCSKGDRGKSNVTHNGNSNCQLPSEAGSLMSRNRDDDEQTDNCRWDRV